MNASQHPDYQWIDRPGVDNEMMAQVQAWLDAGTPLCWRPIYDRENFPQATPEMLDIARETDTVAWLINKADDLLCLPEGIKGWLMPLDADDTQVVCGRWEYELHFMSVIDGRSGERITYCADRDEPVANGAKSRSSLTNVAHP